MKRSLVRIDNRLVHGQILESWVPFLRASRIIVVNDDVTGDLFRESIIRMAVPKEIELIVQSVEEFALGQPADGSDSTDARHTIILFSGIKDVLRAHRLGVRFESINVGNVQNSSYKKNMVGSHLRLSDDEIDDLMTLVRLGVSVEIRSVPRDRPESFENAVQCLR
ncbi:MAG: PTS sugar transporter subunit IIB [Syntrophales bacterium]|nr:PTS sugar transporter subunit IIB [Syntrophales bacterium]MCK9528340.1 PTS sugar transporter subunit IIB [Syntrophales bacterium]MDX9922179.1 PTS sugar transporter subunit IIB [Syntrophales bacterium]